MMMAHWSRDEIAHAFFHFLKVEKHYSAEEIAELEGMHPDTIRRDIKAGLFGGHYFARNPRQLRVSASAVESWRASFRINVK